MNMKTNTKSDFNGFNNLRESAASADKNNGGPQITQMNADKPEEK